MPAGVKTGKCFEVFKENFEIAEISFLLTFSLEIELIIGIHTVNQMGRTNQKVKGIRVCKLWQFFGQMRLHSKFKAIKEFNLSLIPFF